MGSLNIQILIVSLFVNFIWAQTVNPEAEKHESAVWHSYIPYTGAGNREDIYFSKIQVDNLNIPLKGNVSNWDVLQIHQKTYIVGFEDHNLLLVNYLNATNYKSYESELSGRGSEIALFQTWNATSLQMEGYAVVAVEYNNETWLNWYRINENGMYYLWDWPVHRKITHLEIIKLNHELKLLMITHGIFDDTNPVAEMYGFLMEENFDLWLVSRILFNEIPTSATVSHDTDNIYMSVSLPKSGLVQVFKHSVLAPSEKYFTFHQEIVGDGIISVVSFKMNFRWYLGVAGTSSKVYCFNGNGELIPVTNFSLGYSEFLKIIPVKTYRQDVIIIAKKKSDFVVITGTGDGRFKIHGNLSSLICNEDKECLQKMKEASLRSSAAFFKDHHHLIFTGDSNVPNILKFFVRLQPLPDAVTIELNEVLTEKKRLEEWHERQSLEIEKLRNLTKSLLNENNEVELKNKWIVQNLTTVEMQYESLDDIKIKNVEFGQNKNWSKEDFLIDVNDLKSDVNLMNVRLKEIKSNLMENEVESNELATNDLPESITGGFIASGPVYVDELEVEEINGEKVEDILSDLFRLDDPKKIYGTKIISHLTADDVTFERLNDIPASDILFADDVYENSEKNVINGDIVYENDLFITGNVTLFPGGTVNNLNLETDIVRPNVMYNRSTVKFENVKVEEETNIRNINKKPLILPIHNPPFDIHTLDSVNQARIERVNVKNDLKVTFINGRNFTELMEKIIHKNGDSEKIFSAILNGTFSAADLEIDYLNGLKFPEDFILTSTEGSVEITGEKEFLGDLILDNVNVGSNDIEARTGNFKEISLDSNVKVYDNLEIDGILFVETINNRSWDCFENIVRKDEKKPVITGMKNFTKTMKVDHVELYGELNGKNLDDILTKDTDQVIYSFQTFRSVVFKNLTLGNNTYDGVCVNCLNESIIRISENKVHQSSLIFNDSDCFANELNIVETLVDDVTGEEIKFENGSLMLNGNRNFSKVTTKVLKVNGDMNSFGNVNGINLTNLDNRRLSLSRPQTIDHDITSDNLTIRGNVSILVLNGKSILTADEQETEESIIDKIFDGDITLRTVTVKGKIKTDGNVNNANLTHLKESAINIKKGDTVSGLTIFEDPVYFKELNLTGRLDGFSLKQLKLDVVRKNRPVFLRGKKNFVNGLNITKSLRIRTLNGHLIQDIATVQGDHTMNNTVRVKGNVIIRKNLTLHGSINDLAIHDLQRKFSTEFNSFIIPGDATFTRRNITIGKLTIGGKINNVDLDGFMEKLIWKDKDFSVGGNMTLMNEVWFDGNLTVLNNINKLNFTAFSKDIVMKNKPTKIEGGIVLWRAVVKNLNVTYDLNTTLLHGKDTNEWVEESIPLDEDIFVSGKKSFKNVFSNKKISADFINDHPPETMIPLESDQYIPDFIQFSKIHVRSDVPVEGKVNGKNLKDEWEKTVKVSGDQIIDGKVTFTNKLIVDGDAFIPSANGISLENLTTLHTDQVIKTVLSFEGPVVVKNNVEKLKVINGIDIEEWDKNAVLLNREQTIEGTWNILGNVTALKNVEGNALINNISIPVLAKKVEKAKFLNSQRENELDIEYQMQCEALKNLSGELVHQPYLFRQFDLVQVLDSYFISSRAKYDLVIESVITFEANNNHYLILTFVDECYGELNRWDELNSEYIYLKQVKLGPVHKWLVLNHNGTTYLITTSLKNDVLCDDELKAGNVWSFEDEEKYGHLFTTEAFSDVIQAKNSSHVFYTLREDGLVHEWTLHEKSSPGYKFLKDVGKGKYRFVDFEVADRLAVANSRELKKIDFSYTAIFNDSRIPALYDGDVASLPVKGKIFTAVTVKDQVIIYDNILQGNVITSIYSRKPKSLIWLDFGPGKELFLIFQSRGRILEIFEYKGVAGFKRKMSLHIPLKNLQSVTLPDKNNYESHKYLIIVQRKKMYLLRARMLGHLYEENNVNC